MLGLCNQLTNLKIKRNNAVKAFKARVLADGGTFEAETCLNTTLTNLNNI